MKTLTTLLLAVGLLTTGPFAQTTPSPEALLKAAIQREQVDGDRAAALVEYQAIVAKFPTHAVAAQALMQMAGIYDRQGQSVAAREALERIVAQHPNSPQAADARKRLNAAGPQPRDYELTVTGQAQGMLGRGRVSPDGRYISFEDQLIVSAGGTGNLAIWDTQSGATTIVNKFSNGTPYADGSAEESCWSPDGRALAYGWRPPGSSLRELRIVDLPTGRHRVVFRSPESISWLAPFAFSPDGRQVLVRIAVGAGEGTVRTAELALIAVADGVKTTLKTFEGSVPAGATFSPDGRYVAYDFQPDQNSPSRDVAVLATADRRETRITDDRTAHDTVLGWFPDGHLLFTSDRRGGGFDAYVVPVHHGTPTAAALLVKQDVGQLVPQGITKDGRVFVQKTADIREIYVAELDPLTGKAVRPPAPLDRAQPSVRRSEPAWSPDGTRIAYVQSAPGVAQSVVVQTMATNEVRVYPVQVRNIDWPLWHPKGDAFIFDGTGPDNVQRTFRLDLGTGRVDPFAEDIVFGLSPDGEFIYTRASDVNDSGLVRRSLADGRTERISGAGETGVGSTVSPDGRWIAFIIRPPLGPTSTRGGGDAELAIRPSSGGPARVLAENFAAGYARLAWWPDSRSIIVAMAPNGLHRVPIDGGSPVPLGIGGRGFGTINERSMNADGRRLALGVSRTLRQLWVWENLLSKGKRP
jgi:Tol biopolymer transport system component